MVRRLELAGTLSSIDDACLYQYAELFAETEETKRERAETLTLIAKLRTELEDLRGDELGIGIGDLLKLKAIGLRQANELRQGRIALRGYLVEFGMTLVSRTRVQRPDRPVTNKVEQFQRERFFGVGRKPADIVKGAEG